ncbi:hypothetical protein OESDEN_24823 [Oesophagostomum dentatum]|uniref:Uncharacterized protein n=1 Tax=Oesophagostomum dentatum TaxID=61180 RepID=A0A0B1RV99_OESDE|nr:hypothetical protein OESDEN_24823 [Oesophagostomum dentatum]
MRNLLTPPPTTTPSYTDILMRDWLQRLLNQTATQPPTTSTTSTTQKPKETTEYPVLIIPDWTIWGKQKLYPYHPHSGYGHKYAQPPPSSSAYPHRSYTGKT